MFKVEDIVICINDSGKETYNLELNKIYTITNTYYTDDTCKVKGQEYVRYSIKRFMLLTDYRKQKINKILNKIKCQKITQ